MSKGDRQDIFPEKRMNLGNRIVMEQDFTQCLRDIDRIQEKLDKIFKRVNADPIYSTEQQIRDAISDNVRYFPADRKAELCEIFFAVLDQVYDRIVKQDRKTLFCNPQIPPPEGKPSPRLPETDMLMRCMMPLSWALSAHWELPELKDLIDDYLASFSEEEAGILYETLCFLFHLFPEYRREMPQSAEFLEYWRKLAHERDSLVPETDETKSRMLTILLEKRSRLKR